MSNELDKHINKTLEDYASPVDGEALWQSLQPIPKRKRRLFIWLFFGVGILVVLGSIWLHDMDVNENRPNNVLSSPIAIENDNSSVKAEEVTVQKVEHEELKPATIEKTALPQNVHSSNNLPSDSEEGIKIKVIDQFIQTQADKNAQKSKPIAEQAKIQKQNDPIKIDGHLLQKESQEPTFLSSVNKIPNLSFLPSPLSVDEDPIAFYDAMENIPTQKQDQPWFMEAQMTYLKINRSFSPIDSLGDVWLNSRLNNEQVLEAVSGGVSFGYQFNNKFSVSTGIDYTKINSTLSLKNTFTNTDTVHGIQTMVITTQHDTLYTMGPIAAYNEINYDKQTFNSITQWELPILGAYYIEKNNFDIILEGGVRLLLNRSWEGEVLDVENNILDISTQDWYKKNLSIGLQTGVYLGYHLSPQLVLSTGVQYRYSPSNFTNKEVSIAENYQLYGAELGLKWKF